jgi:HK97 family phage prohead protease
MSEHEQEFMTGGELVYRATDQATFQDSDGAMVVEGKMVPYNEPTEINSRIEGHFFEMFLPRALRKTITEQANRMRLLFEHGKDRLGVQSLGKIEELREEDDGAYFRARLFDSVPPLIVDGLRNNQYGSSIRFKPEKWLPIRGKATDYNPEGIEERHITEAVVREISLTPFPQYAGATAHMRSITDEIAAKELLGGDPVALLDLLNRVAQQEEPQHSEREEPEDQAPEPSRRTQPVHDYLNPEEGEPSWRL